MGKMLYVGNLPYGTSDNELQNLFESHGKVNSAQVIMDRDTDHSKGFAFVEMESAEEAEMAIAALNGTDFGGRAITVNEAQHREGHIRGHREYGGYQDRTWQSGDKR